MKPEHQRMALFLGLIMVASLVYQFCAGLPGRAIREAKEQLMANGRELAGFVQDVFQVTPEVRWQGVMVSGQTSPIAELAVIEREYPFRYQWTSQWFGSTKTVEVQGVYLAKAGFDLRKPFRIDIDPETKKVTADLPPAEILSVERKGDLRFSGSSGLWNRLGDEDRQTVLNEFEQKSRAAIEKDALLQEAEKQAGARLQELAERNGQVFEFRFRRGD